MGQEHRGRLDTHSSNAHEHVDADAVVEQVAVHNWNVSKEVTNMSEMFASADSFNQPL